MNKFYILFIITFFVLNSCTKEDTPNVVPTIVITKSPNGTINTTTTTISWSGSDEDGNVTGYFYNLDGVESYTDKSSISLSNLSEGTHFFSVYAIDNENAKSNTSSISFIVELIKSISISRPSKGDEITKGERISVFWSSQNVSDKVDMEIFRDGISVMNVFNVNNTGTYSISTDQYFVDSKKYKVKVMDSNNAAVYGMSEEFSILSAGLSSITLLSLNNGSALYYGKEYEIKWTSYPNYSDRKVSIWLVDNDGFNSYISEAEVNDGSYIWKVPSNLTPTFGYRVFIADQYNQDVFDYSDSPFSIFEKNPLELSVTSPTTGTTWKRGSTYTISWDGYKGSFNIKLYKNAIYVGTIDNVYTTTSNTYQWTVPTSLAPGNDYSIIIDYTQNSDFASSGNFTIN